MGKPGESLPPLVNVQIDGVWRQFPKGTRPIEACEQPGSYVPRYCYHKKLSSPGNCRMCLVEMGMPRMENNYSLNTVDICPVGALTSTDFRFKMRVWFLK